MSLVKLSIYSIRLVHMFVSLSRVLINKFDQSIHQSPNLKGNTNFPCRLEMQFSIKITKSMRDLVAYSIE